MAQTQSVAASVPPERCPVGAPHPSGRRPPTVAQRLPGRGAAGAESGQATVLAALALGGLLTTLLLGAIAIASLVRARAALSAATDAAALAAREAGAAVTATLSVRFESYTCAERTSGEGRNVRRALACQGTPGVVSVGATGASFDAAGGGAFGPDPAWAAAAGCAGTAWHAPAGPGTWRICTGQDLSGASVAPPDPSELRAVAQRWLEANAAGDGLADAAVVAAQGGTGGEVTVEASAEVDLPLLGRRTLRASATAWPGG